FVTISVLITGCAQTRVAKKPVVVEQPKPVPPPEPPPPEPPPPEPTPPLPPPPVPPEVVVTPPPPPQPLPKPVPPPVKKPAPEIAIVKTPPISILGKKVTMVDVLSAPGPDNPVVAQVADKTLVQILSKTANNWYKIKLPEGKIGWISGSFLVIPTKTSP
ncbi:MAG: SH3 domain-containing protein, partial [bacterium]|nr:SH3 domain-containing protein [bacterium]